MIASAESETANPEMAKTTPLITRASGTDITLFTPYFKSPDESRQRELDSCLRKNVANEAIQKIYLLMDDGGSPGVASTKIEIIHLDRRMTYLDWVGITMERCDSGISLLANSDIYFDETVGILADVLADKRAFVTLTRHEAGNGISSLHKNPSWSQDVWAISVPVELPDTLVKSLDFPLGVPRCDNKIAYLFAIHGFEIHNPCGHVRSFHLHETQLRSYSKKMDRTIVGGVAYVHPSPEIGVRSELDFEVWGSNLGTRSKIRLNPSFDLWDSKGPEIVDDEKGNVVIFDADWQYPAITEKHASLQVRKLVEVPPDVAYFGFPWATLIDRIHHTPADAEPLLSALDRLAPQLAKYRRVVTTCQQIHMMKFPDLFAKTGITDIFWSHAVKDQLCFPGNAKILIHPFPLYPVQHEPGPALTEHREFLFSFVGAKSPPYYLTESRNKILELLADHPSGYVKGRDEWHYAKIVYAHQLKKGAGEAENLVCDASSDEFRRVLGKSVFSLCPSGSGPNSIRLWESIGAGAIPVILADTYLPPGNPLLWKKAAVFCREDDRAIQSLPDVLTKISADPELMKSKLEALGEIWRLYGPECFVHDIGRFMNESARPARDESLIALVNGTIRETPPTGESAAALLMACGSRILSSDSAFKEHYMTNGHLRAAVMRALNYAPKKHVDQFLRIARDVGLDLLSWDD